LSTTPDEKYEIILSEERSWARGIALAALKPKPLTVWEVLIPIFIIFNYMRLKGARDVFAQNILFTKKLALDAALGVTKDALSRKEVLKSVLDKTKAILASEDKGIYSEAIRQKQLKEIDLLIDHYCKLLKAEGKNYVTLVAKAYWTQNDFSTFLERLKGAEREVNLAAVATLGNQADTETLSRIEKSSHSIRTAMAKRVFQTAS
jgi:hypothetical protein